MNRISSQRQPYMADILMQKRQEEYLASQRQARRQQIGESEDIRQKKAETATETGKSLWQDKEQTDMEKTGSRTWPPRMDQYIRGDSRPPEEAGPEKSGEESPEKSGPEKPDEKSPEKASPKKPEKKRKVETCIGNTDEVDREIRKLKRKKTQLKQQVAQSGESPERQEKLEKELAQVEQELKMKDNDTYRRQHTKFTNL